MVAGVQKGGTTAMYHYLRSHSEIGLSKRKEAHFFDDDDHDWSKPDYQKLHSLYVPGYMIYGECTPITVYWTAAHKRILAYNPNMSFILLFRDPIERAYSHWCMEYARGRETLTFDAAIRSGRERLGYRPRPYSYVERGFYGAQIETLLGTFRHARMLFLATEELLHDRTSAMRKVAEFVGVDLCGFRSDSVIARAQRAMPYPSIVTDTDREYLREVYRDDMAKFAHLTSVDIHRWKSISIAQQ